MLGILTGKIEVIAEKRRVRQAPGTVSFAVHQTLKQALDPN